MIDESPAAKPKVPTLTDIVSQNITTTIYNTIKQGIARNYTIDSIVAAVRTITLPLTEQAIYMIRKNLLLKFANKVYKRSIDGTIQYYDGRQLSFADTLNPLHPNRLIDNVYPSLWSSLNLEKLVEQYSLVHKARKNQLPHPFQPFDEHHDEDDIYTEPGFRL